MTWPLFLGCLKVPLPRYRGSAAVAGLALRLQQSLEAAAIASSAGLGTLQTPAWRPQAPSADTATFAMAGLPLVLPPCVWSPSLSPTCARMPRRQGRPCRPPFQEIVRRSRALLSHLALWVSLSCPVKIGGDSCAFPTQDLSQLMSAKAADLPLLLLKLLSRLRDIHFDKSRGLVHGSRTAAGRGTGCSRPGAAVPMPPRSIPMVICWPCFY